ncbi:hypothetical protein EEL32_15155 [Brevibacillus laterosporus]|nr:hypothetical protein [Brevibacillus laterosporus]TPG84977.1 hypothetical protein EEL32_15155 [Brevibacillus laterosporus]
MSDPHDIELVVALKNMLQFAKNGEETAQLFLDSSISMLRDEFDKWNEIWNLFHSDLQTYGKEKAIEKAKVRLKPFMVNVQVASR